MSRAFFSTTALLAAMIAFGAPVQAKDPPPPVFVPSALQTLPPPPADQAQIVVFEPINKIQGLFPVGIFELNDTQRTLIGMSSWRSRTIVNLDPGKHRLMATQGFALVHLMDAEVEAGKRYYVLLRFIYGAGMQLRPIRTSGTSDYRTDIPEFAEWQANPLIEMTPAANDMFTQEKVIKNVDKGMAKALENWKLKSEAERAELTLTPADSIQVN